MHGLINGTKAIAPGMAERGRGHIVNVASAAGRIAVADGATYSASKFAAVGFSEATRAELAPLGIDVSMILPSIVATELASGVPATRGVKTVTPLEVARGDRLGDPAPARRAVGAAVGAGDEPRRRACCRAGCRS